MFERLQYIREENDLTQEEVAKIIGVDRSVISKWETNKEIIPIQHLNTFSNYFNVSFDYLSGLSSKRNYDNVNKELDLILIGNRIKEFRNKYNLTLRDLANVLNTSSSTISAYETGKVLILTSFAYNIAYKYEISFDWLCGKTKDSE